jgi:hypothetical protein
MAILAIGDDGQTVMDLFPLVFPFCKFSFVSS